jgi:uncharacterized membrane protein
MSNQQRDLVAQQTDRQRGDELIASRQETSDRQRGDELIASRQEARPDLQRQQARLAQALGLFSIGLGLAELTAPRAVAKLVGIRSNNALLRTMGMREITSGIGILMQDRPAAWMWSRVGGDVIDLALLGRALTSRDTRRGRVAVATAAVAGVTLLDVLSSRQLAQQAGPQDRAVRFTKTITIERSPEDLYAFWRDLRNLPRIMKHVQEIRVIDDRRSHWVVRTPDGSTTEWDAEITEDEPNRRLAWRSLPGAQVENAGSVRFDPAPGGRGTVVTAEMQYRPPAGVVGETIARLFGASPERLVGENLRALKQLMETGEIATTEGQPAGRASSLGMFDRLATR